MTDENRIKYYDLLISMINNLTSFDNFKREELKRTTTEFCKLFRLSRGTTEFYRTPTHEKNNQGEIYTDYDTGEESDAVIEHRFVTSSMAVLKGTLYMAKGEKPLDDEEREKADAVLRIIMSFLTRNRLLGIVERFAFYDDNGYPNVRSFMRYLERLKENNDIGGHTAVRFNLRHFTLINQQIGRYSGDMVIRNYYSMLEKAIGNKGLICRVGGDNFVAIFETSIVDEIVELLRGVPVIYDPASGKRIMVSASAGVFSMPDGYDVDIAGDVMDHVLAAMQSARTGGKDSIVFYSEQMDKNKEKEKKMRLQQLFPIAIINKEFKVFYQPKINVNTGELVGAEALCRWFHDDRIVPPMEFIPLLEQSMDICTLDFYMLDHVCQDISRWIKEGRKIVRISVNLSRKHMMDVDLLDHILNIVDKYSVPHKYIEIELTETTTDVEFRDLKRVVSGLQQAGIYTSVDDFGMGYSSLNLIREIPWNVLKVDKSFLPVDEDDDKSTRSVMFKYVVSMAKELGLECIAEGVETQNQVKILQDNSCFFAQGYYFDKPLSLHDFEARLDIPDYKYKLDR
jgi:diguanylate cyclase (GGDEF)-like protein